MTPAKKTNMTTDDLYQMPGHLVRRANQISMAIFADECGALDLTSVQYAALTAISSHAGLDATRLSNLIAIDRATIGGVIERLEVKGWVERKPSLTDRRVKVLHITEAGIAMLQIADAKVSEVQIRLLANLTREERDQFMFLLRKLVALGNEASRAPRRDVNAAPLNTVQP